MLWTALHFPYFFLEALSPRHASSEPWAVLEGRTVLVCDEQAQELGIRCGMGLTDARALAPRLRTRVRDEAAERSALEGVAGWLCGFSSRVSLEPPQGVLAEVQGSLHLFGGPQHLFRMMRAGIAQMGFSATLAAAPTAQAAWWLAVAGREDLIEHDAALQATIDTLPVSVMSVAPDAVDRLHDLGIATLGELLALPRAGVARRFGPKLLDEVARALGHLPEPRIFFSPPGCFDSKIELPGEVVQAEGVLFAARRLLVMLEGMLAARHAGIRRFTLTLRHRRGPASTVDVALASPGRDAERFIALLRERLGTCVLRDAVEAIRLEAGAFVPLDGRNAELFPHPTGVQEENWPRLIEHLQARLGSAAVYRLGLHPDHRPESAWRRLEEVGGQVSSESLQQAPRPLWLLEPPRRLQEIHGVPHRNGPLALLSGPERIESGWWDGGDVARDYFIARTPASALLWVYREPGGGWYLHGIFS